MFLADIAEASQGGGGSGGLVVNYSVEDLGEQGVKYSLDKTAGEIKTALASAKAVVIVSEEYGSWSPVYNFTYSDSDGWAVYFGSDILYAQTLDDYPTLID